MVDRGHPASAYDEICDLVINSLESEESKRAYSRAIIDFLEWWRKYSRRPLSKAMVQGYRVQLQESGLSPSSINLGMSAVRKLAAEAADNGLLAPELAAGISRVKGAKRQGVRTGNWLLKHQAETLLLCPDAETLKGKRDRALLAALIGCGLRRNELADLTLEHIQQREGRWVIVDLVGKGNRVRTVPMPSWTKASIDQWTVSAGIGSGKVFRPVNKGDRLAGDHMTAEAMFKTGQHYALKTGLPVAPHDLRRTFAKLAHKGKAALEQIQLSLGHASLTTTERYLGVRQDLSDAPCDHLGAECDAMTDDDFERVEFAPGEASVRTTNLCAHFGGCDKCPGWTSVEALGLVSSEDLDPDEPVFCTDECHKVAP